MLRNLTIYLLAVSIALLSGCFDNFTPHDYRLSTKLQGVWWATTEPFTLYLDTAQRYKFSKIVFCPYDTVFVMLFELTTNNELFLELPVVYNKDSLDASMKTRIDILTINLFSGYYNSEVSFSDDIEYLDGKTLTVKEVKRDLDNTPYYGEAILVFADTLTVRLSLAYGPQQVINCKME